MSLPTDSVEPSQQSGTTTQEKRVWASSFFGAAIEFYDFSIYATAAALAFGPLFFSPAQDSIGVVLSFATLAAGYFARPLGAAIFGHIGDKAGRKGTLIMTMVLMALATFLIGVLPTYDQVGVIAPLLLVTLRVLQGVAVGGEWGGAVIMTTEHSAKKRRAFMGSATQTGSALGVLLGFGVFAVILPLSGDGFNTWGWRVPFLATVVLFGVAMYIRLKVEESPVMSEAKSSQKIDASGLPIKDLLVSHWRTVLLAAGVFVGPFMIQACATTFFVSYGVSDLGMSREFLVNATMIGVLVSFFGIPFSAWLADRYGRRRIIGIGVVGATANLVVLWQLYTSGSQTSVVLAVMLVFVFQSMGIAPLGALFSEMFPTEVRYTGVSLTYQLTSLIGGGLGPLFASLLIAAGLPFGSVFIMLLVFCLWSWLSVYLLPRTDDIDLRTMSDGDQVTKSDTEDFEVLVDPAHTQRMDSAVTASPENEGTK